MNKTKCIVLLTLIALLFSTSGAYSIGHVDGNDWLEFNNIEKEIYLEGIFDGLNFMMIELIASFDEESDGVATALMLQEDEELIIMAEEDYDKAINTIDELYFDEENLDKTVIELLLEGKIIEEDLGV